MGTEKKSGKRVTVNLTPKAAEAVDVVTELTGMTLTEVLNQSAKYFRLMVEGRVYIREEKGGELIRLLVI